MRTAEEIQGHVEDFTKKLIGLQLQKKEIDEQIKELKQDYKEEGINVAMVNKVLNEIKKEMKKSESDKFEEDVIREWLERDDLKNLIETLVTM